jgi:hypothetical protein
MQAGSDNQFANNGPSKFVAIRAVYRRNHAAFFFAVSRINFLECSAAWRLLCVQHGVTLNLAFALNVDASLILKKRFFFRSGYLFSHSFYSPSTAPLFS